MYKLFCFLIPLLLFYSPLFAKCTIEINGDKLIKVGKIAKFTIIITNNDESTINNIIIRNKLPFGFKYKQKDTDNLVLKWQVNSLKSKQQKHFYYHLEAIKDGVYENIARLYIENKNIQEVKLALQLISSNLHVTFNGSSKLIFLNKQITFITTITNIGNKAIANVKATQFLGENLEYMSSEPKGVTSFSENNIANKIIWTINKISPKEKIEIKLTARAIEGGRTISKLEVSGDTQKINCEFPFLIRGMNVGIHVSTYDTEDPVEIDSQTIYVITARNEGTSAHTNIIFKNDLPEEMEFVLAEAPVNHFYDYRTHSVIFDPHPILQPGDSLVFKIICKAIAIGSARNTARLRYDPYDKEIIDEEGTSVYY